MKTLPATEVGTSPSGGSRWPRLAAVAALLIALLAILIRHGGRESLSSRPMHGTAASNPIGNATPSPFFMQGGHKRPAKTPASPEEIVARKLGQFARSRREIARAMARNANVTVSDDVERFFDAVENNRWDDADALFKLLRSHSGRDGGTPSPDVAALWAPILETFGVAEQAHAWPAQELLDYGNAVLGSLPPGMAYVGGTDPGRFIPTLINETSDGEHRIVITQNGLADAGYLGYLNFLYGDQATTLTADDSQKAFQDYLTDAQKRLAHDQQFPDEPKQLLPGENVTTVDGKVQVSGQVAVMAINERLLQAFMQNNPDLPMALEESFPLKSTYGSASLIGPITQLRAGDGNQALTPDVADQSLDYWRNTAQTLISDPNTPDGSDPRKAYAKMADAQANLLADHNYDTQAEQAYRLALQIYPGNPESTYGLAGLLDRTGRGQEAAQLLSSFQQNYPQQAGNSAAWTATISSSKQQK